MDYGNTDVEDFIRWNTGTVRYRHHAQPHTAPYKMVGIKDLNSEEWASKDDEELAELYDLQRRERQAPPGPPETLKTAGAYLGLALSQLKT